MPCVLLWVCASFVRANIVWANVRSPKFDLKKVYHTSSEGNCSNLQPPNENDPIHHSNSKLKTQPKPSPQQSEAARGRETGYGRPQPGSVYLGPHKARSCFPLLTNSSASFIRSERRRLELSFLGIVSRDHFERLPVCRYAKVSGMRRQLSCCWGRVFFFFNWKFIIIFYLNRSIIQNNWLY